MSDHDVSNQPLPNGLYDLLLTTGIESRIADYAYVSAPDISGDAFAQLISDVVSANLPIVMRGFKSPEDQIEFANRLLGLISPGTSVEKVSALRALVKNPKDDHSLVAVEPELPLGDFALLTNAYGEPSMLSQLREEMLSADGVDILIAFVFQTGLNTFADLIRKLRARDVRVRLITGVYRGSSEQKAINYLVEELGVEVKINYETHKNHLHAKAWIIHRDSGFTTAFVGSSNISVSAMETGLEWNVRLTKARSPHVLKKLTETFETYWSLRQFESYDPLTDQDRLAKALSSASGGNKDSSDFNFFGIDVTAKPHQAQMLLDLENERTNHDRHENLVVAATGTGKTVLSALDYMNLIRSQGSLPKLLFVAHRKEILLQARATFRAVLKNGEFGEVWADGQKPTEWKHVFASVQAIAKQEVLDDFARDHFEILIIDEFHHADAKSYRRLLDFFIPSEMVGLTATPERGDGIRVQDQFFDGRIATELRLWDALDSGLLAPFHYYGIGEETNFKNVEWKSGGYDANALSNLVTGNDVRDRLVLREIREKIANPLAMKALVFCVSVVHAENITDLFNRQGVSSKIVTGKTSAQDRANAISDLKFGNIQALISVDVFNEGVDIPEVDTVIMLRPTESPVVFLQQLGRGLRLAKDKSVVTVLDFVGSHRAEYRNDLKLSAMTGATRGNLENAIKKGFPYLPAGVVIALDALATENVLANLKNQVRPSKKIIESEIADYFADPSQDSSLLGYLSYSGREMWEIYRHHSWLEFCGLVAPDRYEPITVQERALLKTAAKLHHVDDPVRIAGYISVLTGRWKTSAAANDYDKRLFLMLYRLIWPDGRNSEGAPFGSVEKAFDYMREHPRVVDELVTNLQMVGEAARTLPREIRFKEERLPLFAGARYLRDEILAATGWALEEGMQIRGSDKVRASKGSQSGVVTIHPLDLDALFVTLNKDEKSFSPSTRYQDYAVSEKTFHWESPNSANIKTPLGKRIFGQRESKSDVLIAIQENKSNSFVLAGLADLAAAEGSNPIAVTWTLRTPLTPSLFKIAATANVA